MAAHTNVCVIGLGSMGMGAARACLQAGLNTWGVDINPDNCRALLAAGAKGAGPSAVPFAAELDAVVLLVVNAAQVRGILFGESGLAAHLKPGTAVMVSSTIAAADAQAIAVALAEYQLLMLDAPVSGGAVKAAAGDMTVMASGSDAAFARLAPVLDAVAGGVFSPNDQHRYSGLVDSMYNSDHFLVAPDFVSYAQAQRELDTLWLNQDQWQKKAVLNTANMGWFSSDRTIAEYAREIWGIPVA